MTIKETAKSVWLTDKLRLVAMGNLQSTAQRHLVKSAAQKIDKGLSATHRRPFNVDAVANDIGTFGDVDDDEKG